MDASLYQLGSISEDSHTRAPLASPEDLTGRFDYFDFGGQPNPPKRSPTYPFVLPGPSEEHILKSLGRASNVYQRNQKRRSAPPVSKRIVHTEPNLPGPNQIRHSTTMDTNNSASFEDTAVWDQKSILSLGIYPIGRLLSPRSLLCCYTRVCRRWMTLTDMQMEEVSADIRHS